MYGNCGGGWGFDDGSNKGGEEGDDDGHEKDDDAWKWAYDKEMKKFECHVILMDHIVQCTIKYLDDVSKNDYIK